MTQTTTVPMFVKKIDADIQQDVARELAWDTRLTPNEIGIQVKDAVVTLTGTVDSWAKLRAAQDAAHRVAGVLDVANDLSVKPLGSSERTDSEVAHAVRQALEWDVMVPDQQLQSTVSHGVVTLAGKVESWAERADAERAIERLKGVRHVINFIQINTAETVDLAAAHHAVANALQRHAERDAARIDLVDADGAVNVSGVVHSWQEKEAVLGAVRATRGVRQVDDHLRIERMRP
jgi:osmotically-inducible protein OsmY